MKRETRLDVTITFRRVAGSILVGLLLAVPAAPWAQSAEEEGAEPAPAATPRAPGGSNPDVLRKRLESLRVPKGAQGIRERLGASASPTASPTPAPAQEERNGGRDRGGDGERGAAPPAPSGAGSSSGTRIGNGLVETNPKATKPLPWTQKVSLNQIDDSDLEEVIRTISRATARNFIYDKKDVRNQKVTILAPSPLTVLEAYQAFQTALEGAGLTLVQVGPNLTRILPRRDAKEKPLDTEIGTTVPWNDSFVTRIIRLKNVGVASIQSVVQQLAAKDGQVQSFPETNSLIITDTANNIRRLAKIIEELDRSGGEETIEVVRIHYADVADVADKIQQLFGSQSPGAPAGAAGRAAAAPIRRPTPKGKDGAAPADGAAGTPAEATPLISKVVADARSNQIILQGSDRAIAAVRDFLALIDVAQEGGGGIHVYYLENADAEELAAVLANLAAGNAGQPGGRRARGEGTPPQQPGAPPAPGGGGAPGGGVAVLEGDVKITADKSTNALVITASKSDFESLKQVIQKLDIRRQQVYVEAVIMELSLQKARDLGLSFAGGADVGEGAIGYGGLNFKKALLLDPTALASGFALGLLGPGGMTFNLPNPDGTTTPITVPPFGVVLNALQQDSDTNVLSRPNILAKENEESEIVVATSVAVPGGSTISQTGLQNFSITKEDVGITLKVTPKISESNNVSMAIFQEVKSIVKDDRSNPLQRLVDTGKRSVKTNVEVRNGETIVIGGLISDEDTRSETKVPLLGDIPFLGWLFRSSSRKAQKTNLLIFLTPTIVKDDGDMRAIYERRMREREEFARLYANRSVRKEEKRRTSTFERYRHGDPEKKETEAAPKTLFVPVQQLDPATGRPVGAGAGSAGAESESVSGPGSVSGTVSEPGSARESDPGGGAAPAGGAAPSAGSAPDAAPPPGGLPLEPASPAEPSPTPAAEETR